ncbi:MAG: PHB depolymerase family esterase [Xanthobacteraceae bacterium]
MLSLRKTLASLARNKRKWEALLAAARSRRPEPGAVPDRLQLVHEFGSNPGNLRMFTYLPPQHAANPPLVVVLHGCTQTAGGYDYGAGWSTLADRYGFALLLPEQQRSNNPNGCFNWFLPDDSRRARGEALSIRQMIETFVMDKKIDRDRVFITGLSAGGAMTSVMLACYPEVFAGGAIIAGLPYGAASNVQQAFESMFQSPSRSAREWGDLVRAAAPYGGPWPRISVWHGTVDKIVVPSNAREILKQWTDVHGLPGMPSREANVAGYPRQVWLNDAGEELIESFAINIGHGTPLATGSADGECGVAGPFLLDAGISSSYHIANFFRLTNEPASAARAKKTVVASERRDDAFAAAFYQRPIVGGPQQAKELEGDVLEGELLDKDAEIGPVHKQISRMPVDISRVITRALTAAGLMKPD